MGYHRFFEALLHGRPVTVYGDGRQVRGNTYVADAWRPPSLALDAPPARYSTSAAARRPPCWDVLRLMEQITDRRSQIRREPARPGDQQHTAADTARLRRLGWAPAARLADGLARQWEWHRKEAAAAEGALPARPFPVVDETRCP